MPEVMLFFLLAFIALFFLLPVVFYFWACHEIKQLHVDKDEILPPIDIRNLSYMQMPFEGVKSIALGTYVQIRRAPERFWVKVIDMDGDIVVGRVDNKLLSSDIHGYQYNDTIRFNVSEILKIMRST